MTDQAQLSRESIIRARQRRQQMEEAGEIGTSNGLSYGEVFARAVQNTPKSAAQFVEDTLAPFVSPGETLDSIVSLGKGLVQLAIPGEQADEKTAKAVGNFYANRYGSLEKFKMAFAEDPVGILGDLSVLLTGGGGLAARAPGAVGTAANMIQDVGKAIDPMNVATKSASKLTEISADAVPSFLGMTSSAGRESVSEAYQSGREGGVRQEKFTDAMRGDEDPGAVVDDALSAVRDMRSDRNQKFSRGKSALELEKTPVDLDLVAAKFGEFADSFMYEGVSELSPKGTAKLREIGSIISNWQKTPSLHTAKGLDILKRRIDNAYPDGISPGDSAMVAKRARDIVYREITDQVPDYVKVMKPYEEAVRLEREIQKALSLGKQASADTALRKLQSVMRNNVNANFGQRLNLVNQLESAGDYYLLPRLAGQALSSSTPRGLQSLGATSVGMSSAILDPTMMAALPAFSPRVVGEASLAAGKLARSVSPVTGKLSAGLNFAQQALGPYYPQLQTALMGSRVVGQTARAEEEAAPLTPSQRDLLLR